MEVEQWILRLLSLGRACARKRAPYFSRTLCSLTPVFVDGIGTMGVTPGLVMYIDPQFVLSEPCFKLKDDYGNELGYEYFAFGMWHEGQHIVRGLERLEALPNAELANVAGDIPINDQGRASGWRVFPWVCHSATFGLPEGLTMEQYYARLQNNAQVVTFMQSSLSSDGEAGNREGKNGKKDGLGGARRGPCSGQCGGVAGNPVNKDLERELDEKYGRHEAEVDQVRKSTLRDVQQFIKEKGRGSAPGFDESMFVFKKKKSTINWRRQINYVILRVSGRISAGGDDYSYFRPSKRSIILGVVRPGLIEQKIVPAFIRDTSGSMNEKNLNDADNEVIGVMKQLGLDEVWFLDADVQVQGKPELVRVKDIPKIEAKGRGGTSFIQPLEAVQKLHPKPDLCIYLTDGDGTAPPRAPKDMPVIWCIVPGSRCKKPAPWGHVVLCTDDQNKRDAFGA